MPRFLLPSSRQWHAINGRELQMAACRF